MLVLPRSVLAAEAAHARGAAESVAASMQPQGQTQPHPTATAGGGGGGGGPIASVSSATTVSSVDDAAPRAEVEEAAPRTEVEAACPSSMPTEKKAGGRGGEEMAGPDMPGKAIDPAPVRPVCDDEERPSCEYTGGQF